VFLLYNVALPHHPKKVINHQIAEKVQMLKFTFNAQRDKAPLLEPALAQVYKLNVKISFS